MNLSIFKISVIVIMFLFTFCKQKANKLTDKKITKDSKIVKGGYFDENLPGDSAILFAPGILSTGMHDDAGPIFTNDSNEVYFRIAQAPHSIIAFMKQIDGVWTKPEIAPFSGKYSDGVMCITKDNKKLFFGSVRPNSGNGPKKDDYDLWYVDRNGDTWNEAINLKEINTGGEEWVPTLTSSGKIFYTGGVNDGKGLSWRIMCSDLKEGKYTEPYEFDKSINKDYAPACPCIARDESFLVFTSSIKGELIGDKCSDLFISFRNENGIWSKPKNLGPKINSDAYDYNPSLSPDGKYLFFVSDRNTKWSYSEKQRTFEEMIEYYTGSGNGNNDIYWVSTKDFENLISGN